MKKKRNLKETKIFRNTGKRFGLCLTGLLLTVSMLTGCGGSSKSMYSEMAYDTGGYGAVDNAAVTEEIALSVEAGEAGGFVGARVHDLCSWRGSLCRADCRQRSLARNGCPFA